MSFFESVTKLGLRLTAVSLGYAVLPFVLLVYTGPELGQLVTPIGGIIVFIVFALTFGVLLQYVCRTKTRTASKYVTVVATVFAIGVYLFAIYSNISTEGSALGTLGVLSIQAVVYLLGVSLGHRVYAKKPIETVYERVVS